MRRFLPLHEVATAHEQAWSKLQNGELIAMAECAGFDVFVTADRNLKYHQNLTSRRLAVVLLSTTSWSKIQRHLQAVDATINHAQKGSFHEVSVLNAREPIG